MKDNPSPEEKLLKLIRGEKRPRATATGAAAVDKKNEPPLLKAKPAPVSARSRVAPLVSARFLWASFAAVSILFAAAAFIYPLSGLDAVRLPDLKKMERTVSTAEVKPEVRPLESYLEGLRAKQIFAPPVSVADAGQAVAQAADTLDSLKDITLVGIISSNPPQAVIEDKKTQRTYTLSNGQSLGEFKVENIEEGKVTLNHSGTKFELFM